MLGTAQNLWGRATDVIASTAKNAADHLDNLGAAIKDTLNEDLNNNLDDSELYAEDLEEYKRMLSDMEMQQVELSKQSRMALANKEAELDVYRAKLKELLPDDASLQDAKSTQSVGNLEIATIQAENKVLQETTASLQAQLQDLKNIDRELLMKDERVKKIESRYSRAIESYNSRIEDLETSEKQKLETIEQLVEEYSKLAADTEKTKLSEESKWRDISQKNEVLSTKVVMLEQAVSDIADKSTIGTVNDHERDTAKALKSALQQIDQLAATISSKEQDLNKAAANYSHLKEELEKLRKETNVAAAQTPPPPAAISVAPVDVTDSAEFKMAIKALKAAEQSVVDVTISMEKEKNLKEALELEVGKNNEKIKVLNEKLEKNLQLSSEKENQLDKMGQLEKEKNELRAELEKEKNDLKSLLEKEKNELNKSVASESEKVTLLEKEKMCLNDSIEKLRKSESDLSSKMNEKDAQLSQLISDHKTKFDSAAETHAAETKRLQSELEVLKAGSSSSQAESQAALDKLHELQAKEVTLLTDKHNQAVADLEKFKSDTLSKEQEALKLHAVELENLNEKLTKEASGQLVQFENRLSDAKQEHASAMKQELNSLTEKLNKNFADQLAEAATASKVAEEKAVSAAVEANTVKLIEASRAEIENLKNEFAKKELEIAASAKADLESALFSSQQKAEAEKQAALAATNSQAEEKLQQSLQELGAQKDAEAATSLTKAVNDAVSQGKLEVEAMREKMQVEVTTAESERDQAKEDLANVEVRFIKKQEEAIALRDKQVRAEMQGSIDAAKKESAEYLELYTKENKTRKAIHNKLLELQGNIRVICRVRPMLEVERKSGEDSDVTGFPSDEDITIQKDVVTRQRFEYDRVFQPLSVQVEVFNQVQPVCVSVLDGYNVCIFAYGQTGSGKTYTMEGGTDSVSKGVSPRAVDEVFRLINDMENDWEYTVSFSMLEIYNETIRDLLISPEKARSKDAKPLEIRSGAEGNTVPGSRQDIDFDKPHSQLVSLISLSFFSLSPFPLTLPGLTEVAVTASPEVSELMIKANKNRAVGSHDMNEHSSRSHSILTMVCRGKSRRDDSTTFGKLNLIDLAGSERVGKTDASGERLKEAQNINRSLSALGDVINALGNKKSTHIPYRNSKLTFLLQDSLGGNSKCLMFVNISPAVYNLGETVCSLNFASRCRNVELGT